MDFPRTNVPTLFQPSYGRLRKFDEDLVKMLDQVMSHLNQMFNKGIELQANTDTETLTVTTAALANNEFTVGHSLKRIPVGYLVISRDKAGVVYNGTTPWTTTEIYLKCDAATMLAKLVVF